MSVPPLASVVIIADASLWTETISRHLSSEGFRVVVDPLVELCLAGTAEVADIAVVDLSLPAGRALEVIAEWRTWSETPILAVAHRADEPLIVDALEAGADQIAMISDGARLLAARLRTLLRRGRRVPASARATSEGADPLTLLPAKLAADLNGALVELTEHEFAVLELLLRRPDRVVRRADFVVMRSARSGRSLSLDFVVRRLRQKLEAVDPCRRIVAVRGVGFRFTTSCSCDVPRLPDPEPGLTGKRSPKMDRTFIAGSGAGQNVLVPSLIVTGEGA